MDEERDILALRQGYLVHKLDFWATNLERNVEDARNRGHYETATRNDAMARAYREIQEILLGADDNYIDNLYAMM
jgi:hypothetical protein